MAQQTRAALASDQATNLADASDITAADLRGEITDLTDSALLREDIDTIAELNAIVADATIVTQGGALGTPASGVATNLTGTAAGLTAGAVEGTGVLSTGEAGGTKFLREDGDGTCSWQTPSGSGDVTKVGTPANNQLSVWTGDGTIEGESALTYAANVLTVTGNIVPEADGTRDIGTTSVRYANGFFDSITVTDDIDTTSVATVSAAAGDLTWIRDASDSDNLKMVAISGTGNYAMTASPTFTGTPVIPSGFTLGANAFTRSGAHDLTLTTGATTNVTLPAAGTLAILGANTFTGTQDFNGQQVEGMLNKVVATVTGALTTTAHSGNFLETSGNVTVPTTAGFNCVLLAGGAHTVTFNSTTSAAMATGDLMTIIVEDATTIHAVLTAAADKVTFT